MRAVMRAAVLISLLMLPSCTTPTQYGGLIEVDTAGFARRMEWLCHWGMQGAKASACVQEQKPVAEREQSADAGNGAESQTAEVEQQEPASEPSTAVATAQEEGDAGAEPSQR